MYLAAKHTHMLLALLSILFFYFNTVMRLKGMAIVNHKGIKIASHVVNGLLLLSAGFLLHLLKLNPFTVPWLFEKTLLVVAYIVLAIVVSKQTKVRNVMLFTTINTFVLLAIGYLASTKQALIF